MGNYHIDIGKQLKALRLEQKKDLKDIAKDTKVSESYLEAIEAGLVENFPSTVYYNLFARSYARELGQDPELMFVVTTAESLELERVEALGPEATEDEIKGLEDTESNNNNGSMAKAGIWIAAIVIIIFIVIIYIFNSGDKDDNGSSESIPNDSTPEVIAETPMETVQDSLASSTEIEPEEIIPPKPVGPEMKLRFDVTDLSWLLVMSDGDTVLNRNLDSGSYRTITAFEQFLISAGNPNGLIIKLNDTLLKPLSSTGRPIRDFEITNVNKQQYYQIIEEEESEEPDIGEL
ncbi:MAG: helix-turn-helix domain-containing protein [candidate division Zixibacteria bacterium]|nr:helix-turn-helix domain-containing protein [candidate division Zixibacteria bacterium]